VVVISTEDLRALIREEVRAAVPQMDTPSRWKWLGPVNGPKRFGLSPQAWAALLDSGRLPSTLRNARGGRPTRFVREIDAVRVLTPKGAT
jgi:hypothetical protein